MSRLVEFEGIASLFRDGMTVMSAGFMGVGAADYLIERIVGLSVKNLTLITSDTARPGVGAGRFISAGRVAKLVASHIGTNPDTGRLLNEGRLEVELVPQGTLVERIRAGGHGLGGILTPTGVGTDAEKGKRVIAVDGRDYLLETPLRADVALLRGSLVDRFGNVRYLGTTRNFNPAMALAADIVIVEAAVLLEDCAIDPNDVMTPGVLVDFIVRGRETR
jgi:acetate CoA/acetoacetate CoA-transferase alpha subunit